MKKKNLATAMAAAMAFGGVAPVVANANEPQGRSIIEGTEATAVVNVALANGKEITTNLTYRDVYNTDFTETTKDDFFKDSSTEILSIVNAKGEIVKIPATTPGDEIKLAITRDIKNITEAKKAEIAQAKGDLKDTKAEIERLLALTTTVKGKEVKAYKIDTKSSKQEFNAEKGMPVVTVKLVADNGSDVDDKTFTFIGLAMDAIVTEPSKVFGDEKIDLGMINVATGKAANITTFNKAVYELKTAINEGEISVQKEESGNDLVLRVYSVDKKEELGTYTLVNFAAFKTTKYAGFVELSNLKDLNELDLPELSWAKEDVINALASGKVAGDERGFRAKDSITRAEFAKMIVELGNVKLGEAQKAKETFTDVDGEWFAPYVAILETKGIVEGDGNGEFRPYDAITRQEAAVMIAAMNNQTKDIASKVDGFNRTTGKAIDSVTKFKDDKSIELWADAAVKYLQDTEISRGDENGNYNPANNITRAESVVMITKAATKGNNSAASFVEQN